MAATLTYAPSHPERTQTPQQRLEQLYAACRDDVYAYVASLLRDTAAAEDVTSLAFERAFRRRRLFDARRGSERAWLFGIARNAALDALRRRRRTGALLHEIPAAEEPSGDQDGEAALRRATVSAALEALAPRERELIALKFHAGLSNPDIARVLGVSESNAGTLLHRTVTKLRKACDEQA